MAAPSSATSPTMRITPRLLYHASSMKLGLRLWNQGPRAFLLFLDLYLEDFYPAGRGDCLATEVAHFKESAHGNQCRVGKSG